VVGERALHALPLETFVRQELMCIVYALATPPSAVISLVVIAAFTVDSLILLWTIDGHSRLLAVQGWQPWTILIFGACAALLAVYGARRQRREVALIVEAERSAALHRLVYAYLAVRDLVNTPLQTLTISLSLLASRFPAAREITDPMARSVERLAELNRVLTMEASKVALRDGTETFDAISVLQSIQHENPSGH
jgi:hypothetical protein